MKKLICIILIINIIFAITLCGCSNGDNITAVVTATPTPGTITATPTPRQESDNITKPVEGAETMKEVKIYDMESRLGSHLTEGLAFVQKLGLGWNLGNTFDAFADDGNTKDLDYESVWVKIKTTREMIHAVKERGFSSVRIPVSWHNHVSGDDFQISEAWMNRVKEVVDWCLEEDMYVILNTHHDVYPEYYYPSSEYLESSLKYVDCIWTQLCEVFGDYDNRLIFESLNEPRLKDTQYEWVVNTQKDEVKDAVDCINKMNQEFVKIVRESGKNNADRFLMVPGYDAAPEGALTPLFVLPEDTAKDRLIVSVHAYTPYNFALAAQGDAGSIRDFDASKSSSTKDIDWFMEQLYDKFISKDIPVVIGEFGARDKSQNTDARTQWAGYYVAKARSLGMSCLWWDNNSFVTGTGEDLGLLQRVLLMWRYEDILNAMFANC